MTNRDLSPSISPDGKITDLNFLLRKLTKGQPERKCYEQFPRIKSGKWLIVLSVFLLYGFKASGQNLTRQMVNQLLIELQQSKPDTNRVRILVELGKFHVYKQGEYKLDLDSSFFYLEHARLLSDSLRSIKWKHASESMLVIVLMERGKDSLAASRFSQLIEDCRKTDDKENEAVSLFRLGVWLSTQSHNTDEAVSDLAKASLIYKEIKNRPKAIEAERQIAFIHFNAGKTDLAEKELLEVINGYKAIRYPKLHYTYNLLSTVYRVKGDFNNGLKYAILTIESMNASHDTSRAAYFYGDLARMYMEVGKHVMEIEWYKKAIATWRQQKLAEFGMYLAEGYVIGDMIAHKKIAQALNYVRKSAIEIPPVTVIDSACIAENMAVCYNALHEFPLAEKYYLESLQLYTRSNMNFEVSQEATRAAGTFYLEQKQYDKAGFYLCQTLKFNPQKLSLAAIRDVHYMLYQVDSAKGDYLSALAHYRLHKILNDSLFNKTKIREIEELQIQFQTVEKERDFQLLSNKSKLQQTRLQQADQNQKVALAGTLLMILIAGLIYNQYRIKQKSNKLLQRQQTEISHKNDDLQNLLAEKEWLLKEIHHRVKNNLQIVISLLNTQAIYIDNNVALDAIRESKHRMHSISLIHQKLYQSENLACVDMFDYISELVKFLQDSFDIRNKVGIDLQVEPLELDVAHAVPIGLILNEAITNAIKYAFPGPARGKITITLDELDDRTIYLVIEDNGVGLPEQFDLAKINSLGMNLMKGLTTQLRGDFRLNNDKGLAIHIVLPKKLVNEMSEDLESWPFNNNNEC
jgi:two-component sensor histidine kinase/tetratricopeptide (TPR) repeat protein